MGIDAFKGKKQYTTSVKMIKKTKSFSEEDYLSAGITIPFLISAKRKSGTNFQLSNFQELRKNVIGTNYIGIFKEKSKTTGFLSKNSHRLVMFAGKFQDVSKMEAGEKKTLNYRFAGNYKYEYHRDKFDQVKFFEELHKLSHRIGFTNDLLKIITKIPDKKLGFVQIQADLIISNQAIFNLMKMKERKELKSLHIDGEKFVKDWFKRKNKLVFPLCSDEIGEVCYKFFSNQTKKGISEINEGLMKMSDIFFRKKGPIKEFVKGMSLMGEGLSKNKFTFRVFRHLLKKAGDHHLVVTWQGEKIPRGEKVLIQSKTTAYEGINVKGNNEVSKKARKIIHNFLNKN